jgi:hypothetical protein
VNYPNRQSNVYPRVAAVFIVAGAFMLLLALVFSLQVEAFIGLGLVFWGAIFAVAKNGKFVESSLLDSTTKSSYSTFDRMISDLKLNGKAYYIPPYPADATLPQYLANLKEPVVFISEGLDGKPSVEELAAGKFLSEKSRGVFVASPGSGIMTQMEKVLHADFNRVDLEDIPDVLPKVLTEQLNLAKAAKMNIKDNVVSFKAIGVIYESLYRPQPPMISVATIGCPVVSAVASAIAKSSGKTVVVKEQMIAANSCGVQATLNLI